MGAPGGDDLDDVAVLELVVERHEAVVDLRPDAGMADVGVDAVREVERRRARGQVLDVAARREHEHLVLEEVELEALDELGGVGDVALPLHELAHPGELRVVGAVGARAFLVAPVGRDADLADAVHLVGPDLHLERLAVERDDRRVEALVHVVLGHRDVVVELPGDGPPQRVHDAERAVAVPQVVDEHAQRVDVVDLAELRALALHLAVDAVDVLRAARELGARCRPRRARPPSASFARWTYASRAWRWLSSWRGQRPVGLGLEHLEGEVLELPLELPDPEPLRERRVDLGGLARDAQLLLGGQRPERAHVVEPVGELDEDDADVLRHREEHLADVLGLLLLVAERAELRELRDAVDEVRDVRPEPLLEVVDRVLGVLGDVVEQRRLDRDRVEPELGEDAARPRAGA